MGHLSPIICVQLDRPYNSAAENVHTKFVADFLRHNSTFPLKVATSHSWATSGGLRGNVHCSLM